MQNFKKNMHACEAAAGEKLEQNGAHFPQPTTRTSFGNFMI